MTSRTLSLSTSQRAELVAPSRGVVGHIFAVLLQPVAFFRRLPTTRHWLLVAFLLLVLVAAADVRRPQPDASADIPTDFGSIPPGGFDPSAPALDPSLGGGFPPNTGIPPDIGVGGSDAPDISQTTVTGLIAAGGILLAWAIQSLILAEVSLLNGEAPKLARNLQIAVWASVPLGVMALAQLIFYALGGSGGQIGITALLARWEGYAALPTFSQSLLHSLAQQATLFWFWSAILVYTGARQALRGRWWAAALAVVIWIVLAALLPVLTGAVEPMDISSDDAPAETFTIEGMPSEMGEMPLEGGNSIQISPPAGGAIQVIPIRP
jgi:hypothetical protein